MNGGVTYAAFWLVNDVPTGPKEDWGSGPDLVWYDRGSEVLAVALRVAFLRKFYWLVWQRKRVA